MTDQLQDPLIKIADALRAAKRIAVLSHYNPDADAYGSSCALALTLRDQGKTVTLVNQDGPIERYRYIPFVETAEKRFSPAEFDAVVVCDCGDPPRVGDDLKALLSECKILINLDHHISNQNYGTLNHVEVEASSTSQIVFDLIQAAGWPVSRDAATALFAGVMGDTGSFRYASTSEHTFAVAKELVRCGAKPNEVADQMYSQNSLGAVRLHAEALANLRLYGDGKVCELVVTEEMLKHCGADSSETENLVEKARDIQGVIISYLVRWDAGIWRVSLRSKLDRYNVSVVAQTFGGGGHVQAAAFRWRKDVAELLPKLRAELEAVCAAV